MRDEDPDTVDLIGPAEEALIEHIAAAGLEPVTGVVDAAPDAGASPRCGDIQADDQVTLPVEPEGAGPSASASGIPAPREDSQADEIDIRTDPGDQGPPEIPAIRPPSPDDAPQSAVTKKIRRGPVSVALVVCVLTGIVGWQMTTGPGVCHPPDPQDRDATSRLAAETVARRIITAESGGDATATNDRSTATGAGQFLEATWLEMIDRYRPDLSRGSEAEILDLRHDPDLSREMVSRFAEKNANMLLTRCLPVTPGTLYLSHFAGGGGAVAVLSAAEDADAATTMAMADSTGKTTRSMIVTANPFLRTFTVADLKQWAEAKMELREGQSL